MFRQVTGSSALPISRAALVDGRCGDVGMESFVRCSAGSGVVAIIEKNICDRLEVCLFFWKKRFLGEDVLFFFGIGE